MNPFDIVIVAVTAFCLIRGLFRGLIREASSIIGVLGGFYGAYTYYPEVAALLARWLGKLSYLNILSFLTLFCTILIAVGLIGALIRYLLNITFLGWIDRLFGGLFGMVKGGMIVSVLLIALTAFLPEGAPLIRESRLSGYVAELSTVMVAVASKEVRGTFMDRIERARKAWRESE